jgi:GxxExxY protein
MAELMYKEEVYAIVGAVMDVYNELGHGFLEPVYHEALEIEFGNRHISFASESPLRIVYKGTTLKKKYEADFLVYEKIAVEIKATLTSKDEAQLLNYLNATKFRVGVLINFGFSGGLQWKRMVL